MPISQTQIQAEQAREQQFNQVAERVISVFPWGQFYGLMKGAANLGEGMIKTRVCIAPDGRLIDVAQSKHGKWIKSFIRPAHEHAMKAFSQKKYGRGVLGLAGFGWLPNIIEQQRAICVEVIPNDIIAQTDRREQQATWFDKNREQIMIVTALLVTTALIAGVATLRRR